MKLPDIAKGFQEGVGVTLGFIAVVVGLGTVLGKMLAESGGAEVVATTLTKALGEKRLHWTLMMVAFAVGLPVFFGVGLVLLVPILFNLARATKAPLLSLAIPVMAVHRPARARGAGRDRRATHSAKQTQEPAGLRPRSVHDAFASAADAVGDGS